MFELRDQDFRPLTTNDNHSNQRWNIAQPRTTVESNFLRSSDTEKAFESINDNLAKLIDIYTSNVTFWQKLINDFQLNHQVQLIPTSHNNNIIKTDQHRTLNEWYSGRTLNTVLEEWEKVGIASLRNQKEYIKILCYNVEGWGTRAVEAIDLVYEVQASDCIFTEVGELWNTCRLPHFNTFYQKGTKKNGGACIAVGKHLKATRIEVNIPNTVI
ncbi:unnamed protein product [Rotaria socialis]|uniref:Endonuclease/exonuclease/phosphatase domain-containing protein n=1 Tax=Rotaria socialis TaxID=392032 RepID=A0A821I352_9BILA|nr:unnamed protein product [Rotaria socialis]